MGSIGSATRFLGGYDWTTIDIYGLNDDRSEAGTLLPGWIEGNSLGGTKYSSSGITSAADGFTSAPSAGFRGPIWTVNGEVYAPKDNENIAAEPTAYLISVDASTAGPDVAREILGAGAVLPHENWDLIIDAHDIDAPVWQDVVTAYNQSKDTWRPFGDKFAASALFDAHAAIDSTQYVPPGPVKKEFGDAGGENWTHDLTVVIPEPGVTILVVSGLGMLVFFRKRK